MWFKKHLIFNEINIFPCILNDKLKQIILEEKEKQKTQTRKLRNPENKDSQCTEQPSN